MKITVTMKDPDTLLDCVRDAVKEEVEDITGIDQDEKEGLIDGRVEEAMKTCRKWFRYSEYLTVEVDTEAETCIVLPN